MIPVELPWLVFACLFVILAGIFLVWICYEIVERNRAAAARRHRLRCALCSMEFADASGDPLPRCPRCGSLNERRAPRFF